MCALDYDGTWAHTDKVRWFQGRAIWVYSFFYSHFGKAPWYLEVARKIKEFVLKYALQEDAPLDASCSRSRGRAGGGLLTT